MSGGRSWRDEAMRTIASPRLVLEPQVAAHAPAMFAVLGDPALYRYEHEPPHSAEWLHRRFTRLETRQSGDGKEQWLNWVLRLAGGDLIGYVQATVTGDGRAAIAYVLHSAQWGRGLATEAVEAMIAELETGYDVHTLTAVLKGGNLRSLRLLERLGFSRVRACQLAAPDVEPDEWLMVRDLRSR